MSYDKEEHEGLLVHYIQKQYMLMASYFEAKGMVEFTIQFKNDFKAYIQDKTRVLETEEYDGESYLLVSYKFNQYLAPFKAFSKKVTKHDGFDKLTSILIETPHILKTFRRTGTGEANVYKQVQWVLDFYFDTRPTHKARFISKFKTYRPDILVPELETAIEYKLVKKRASLDDYIDQLAIDAKNYRGDPFYNEFIAVICLVGNIATKKDIEVAWKQKQFNSHWYPIIVAL